MNISPNNQECSLETLVDQELLAPGHEVIWERGVGIEEGLASRIEVGEPVGGGSSAAEYDDSKSVADAAKPVGVLVVAIKEDELGPLEDILDDELDSLVATVCQGSEVGEPGGVVGVVGAIVRHGVRVDAEGLQVVDAVGDAVELHGVVAEGLELEARADQKGGLDGGLARDQLLDVQVGEGGRRAAAAGR